MNSLPPRDLYGQFDSFIIRSPFFTSSHHRKWQDINSVKSFNITAMIRCLNGHPFSSESPRHGASAGLAETAGPNRCETMPASYPQIPSLIPKDHLGLLHCYLMAPFTSHVSSAALAVPEGESGCLSFYPFAQLQVSKILHRHVTIPGSSFLRCVFLLSQFLDRHSVFHCHWPIAVIWCCTGIPCCKIDRIPVSA